MNEEQPTRTDTNEQQKQTMKEHEFPAEENVLPTHELIKQVVAFSEEAKIERKSTNNQFSKNLRLAIAVAASSLLLGCPTIPPSPASDSTPPGFLSVLVTLETGTAPGSTTVTAGPIDLAAAARDVIRTALPTSIGTIRVVATAGDPESGISNLTINGGLTLHCGSRPGSILTGAGTELVLNFTPTFTPSTPPSTPATLTAVATPIVQSGCSVPARPGFTLSSLQGDFTVTATSLGGSTTTRSFSFYYTNY